MKHSQSALEAVSALKWYFEAKNLALKNAIKLRCPLSPEQQNELRLYYSGYLANLVSATEALLEKEYPYHSHFKTTLESRFVFDGHPDGVGNYDFLREFRNAVIHRGHDITSSAHVAEDFLMVLAPPSVTNRAGTKVLHGLGQYLLEVIWNCETAIGPAIAKHLADVGLLEPALTQEEAVLSAKAFLADSDAMPQWAKQMAIDNIGQVDHVEAQRTEIGRLIELLKTNAVEAAGDQQATLRSRPASRQRHRG